MTSTRWSAFLGLALLLTLAAPASAKRQRADLIVKSVEAPASATAGSGFAAAVVVKNKGKRKAGRSKVAFTLSATAGAGPGGVALGDRSVPKLKPGKKSRRASDLTVPAATKPGAYFLIACADGRRKVKEKSDGNNCKASRRKLIVTAAAAPAKLALTPAARTFAPVVAAQRSAPVTFTATNTGGTTTGTIGAQVSGAGFIVGSNGCTGTTLAPGASCTVAVIFGPPAVRSYSGTLAVTAPGTTASAALAGTGAAPGAAPGPAKLTIVGASFVPTEVGTTSAPATFTVTNSGGLPTGTLETELDSGPFRGVPAADECTGTSLAAGASCTFAMVFEPAVRGAAAGSISVTASPGGTVTEPVSGTGLAPASLSVSPSPGFDFGEAVLGSATPPSKTFTVTNGGDVPAAGLAAALSGGNAADFAITGGTCPAGGQLAGGASCTVEAEFDPQAAGLKQTALQVSGTPGGSASTTLSGQGVTPAALGFDMLVVNFGSVPFSSSSTRTLTLRNTGGASTSAISLEITGTNANRFAIEPTGNTCSGQTLAGGATCTFTIRFTPTNVGAKTAFVTASATQGGAGSARLDGTGT